MVAELATSSFLDLQADTEIIAERNRLISDWKAWYESKQEWIQMIEAGRRALLGDRAEEGEFVVQEVEAEVPIGMPTEDIVRN